MYKLQLWPEGTKKCTFVCVCNNLNKNGLRIVHVMIRSQIQEQGWR